ncbi:hypothetical protein [Amycolatopsis albispora]|uniref:Acyl-CoA dehydrogenase/oxidase N-terminal domain-containing protein n=1 Tax=Amycolatopsis albispora TaxID=1804986 RepID=A0A344L9Q2_9PSEU|nr:hypothetical protein [Amycolatopsis albispora]AXB44776.1 hypothetical protein A4R43_21615 [Amycolatopsis albispora]
MVLALESTGVLRIGIPSELGGYEFSPSQVVRTIEQLSYHDASVGWTVLAVQFVTGSTAGYLGTAVRADGGYRISGRWGFASGIPLATHIHTAAFCAETGEALVFTFPRNSRRSSTTGVCRGRSPSLPPDRGIYSVIAWGNTRPMAPSRAGPHAQSTPERSMIA